MLYGAFAVFSGIWAVTQVTQGHTAAAILFFALTALLLFQTWTAWTTLQAEVTVDAAGIRRKGGWGWDLPWEKIADAYVDDYKSRDYLVVMRLDPNAPNHQSSAYLWGSQFPKNALVSPLPYDRRDEVADVVAQYRPGTARPQE